MKLLLTSAGIKNKSLEDALSELLDKPITDSSLVFIPTAANTDGDDKRWVIDQLQKCVDLNFQHIDIVDIAAIDRDMFLPRLQKADVIMVGGGSEEYLMSKMKENGLDEDLQELLKTRVYVGISAGSMVLSELIYPQVYILLYEESQESNKSINGLGFVDFSILAHLNSESFPKMTKCNIEKALKQHNINDTFYVLGDSTAIQVNGESVKVIGDDYVKFG